MSRCQNHFCCIPQELQSAWPPQSKCVGSPHTCSPSAQEASLSQSSLQAKHPSHHQSGSRASHVPLAESCLVQDNILLSHHCTIGKLHFPAHPTDLTWQTQAMSLQHSQCLCSGPLPVDKKVVSPQKCCVQLEKLNVF